MSKEKIQDSTFPLYFSIIVNDAVNLSKLNSQGYPTMYSLFLGENNNYKYYKPFNWRGVNNNLTILSKPEADFILVFRFCYSRFTEGKHSLPTNTRNCP